MSKIPVWNIVCSDGIVWSSCSLTQCVCFCAYLRFTGDMAWIECKGVRMNEDHFLMLAAEVAHCG